MENMVLGALILLLAQQAVTQSATNTSSGSRLVSTMKIAGTRGNIQDNSDYMSMLRGALARGFASIPASVKFQLLKADVSRECQVGLLRSLRGFLKLDPWALRLFDASGKYPTGLLQGSRADMGAFDECLETEAHDKSGNVFTRGQYCNFVAYIKNSTAAKGTIEALSNVLHPKFQYFKDISTLVDGPFVRLGICFIDLCGQDDLQVLVDSLKLSIIHLEVSNCVTAGPEPWTTAQIAITSCLGVLLVIIIFATTMDYMAKTSPENNKKRSALFKFVVAFSATSNTRDLLKVADKSNADQYAMQFMHGMRFLCLVHLVIGHFYITLSDSWSRLLNMFISSDKWTHMISAAASNSAGTFFFLRQTGNGLVVFATDVAKRLIRFCLPLFFIIICLYLLPHLVTGPNARAFFQKFSDEVSNHWWQLLLQIRNFYEITIWDVLPHTWYLSADFQLFLVALPTLLILRGRKMALVAVFSVLSVLSCAIGTLGVARSNLLPFMIFPGPDVNLLEKTYGDYYIRPYYHGVCYFSGCMTFILMKDFRKRNISKSMQLAGWCVSVTCGLTSVFGKLAWYRSPNPTSEAVTLLAAFFDRILWSIFVTWMTLACFSGRAGFVGKFLSWKAFVPLSKLSFGVYLIHLPFMQLMLHASRERVLWSHFNLVTLGFAVLVWSFLLSYLTYLACEAPTTKLNSLIFTRIVGREDARKQKQPEQSA
ncbi:nose resistant to fluoxetine protein 6-like isoform X2 [Dermacentor albipictus]|uniref:nose resistant to fluoxetine protein 6-like isoform X2 n=1 Tax=Dermacentor albipictus TaxID=60249 RepID=UPI0038FD3EEC